MSTNETAKTTSGDKRVNIKLEPLVDNGNKNNFGGCEIKWKSKLDANGLWKYIGEVKPESLNLKLKEDQLIKGLKQGRLEEITVIAKGNQDMWEKVQKDNAS
jgi:hypothetical protein